MKYALFTIVFSIGSLLLYAQCYNVSNVYTFDYNGHTYKVVKENKNWNDASGCAVADGGYLAHINDIAEQNALFSSLTIDAGIVEETL